MAWKEASRAVRDMACMKSLGLCGKEHARPDACLLRLSTAAKCCQSKSCRPEARAIAWAWIVRGGWLGCFGSASASARAGRDTEHPSLPPCSIQYGGATLARAAAAWVPNLGCLLRRGLAHLQGRGRQLKFPMPLKKQKSLNSQCTHIFYGVLFTWVHL